MVAPTRGRRRELPAVSNVCYSCGAVCWGGRRGGFHKGDIFGIFNYVEVETTV